jgi:deoxyribodipyrimidine photo-lyase
LTLHTPPPIRKALVWFRRDLRCFDHAALQHALKSNNAVYCAFIYDTDILSSLPPDDRRLPFIHASVAELDRELRVLGGALLVRHGSAAASIVQLAAQLDVDAVYTNHDYEPQAIERDAVVAASLLVAGRYFASFKDQVIFEKNEVLSQAGRPFSVYTPYKNAWLRQVQLDPACVEPYLIEPYAAALAPPIDGETLPSLEALDFGEATAHAPTLAPGMSGGAALFDDFVDRMADYKATRDYPGVKGPSYLSTHLRFGTVSVRHLVRTALARMANGTGGEGAPVWLSELIWRDFYAMILFHHPHVAERAFKPAYDAIVWESGPAAVAAFTAWCEGRTGYPLVDAAMAQLNQTGYMHNRLRMVSACFLIKDLGIDWRWGERYFARQLIDFDLASNNGGWQWAASTGCDAQPYFRIFNPVTQSEKFDPQGRFIRRYLPQLNTLPDKDIHAPWLVPAMLLEEKGIRLGTDYPEPIVRHDEARALTLARYAVVKN